MRGCEEIHGRLGLIKQSFKWRNGKNWHAKYLYQAWAAYLKFHLFPSEMPFSKRGVANRQHNNPHMREAMQGLWTNAMSEKTHSEIETENRGSAVPLHVEGCHIDLTVWPLVIRKTHMKIFKGIMVLTTSLGLLLSGAAFAQTGTMTDEQSWFGGPIYDGQPALEVTAALVKAGGGAEKFTFSQALVSMLGEKTVNAEV
ncbi:MAG: hypothetical protein ABI144_00665, partial [Gallionella sp.]